jgi:hypothetical protein
MAIFIFSSAVEPSIKCYTCDSTGKNLPAPYAPWRNVSRIGTSSLCDPVAKAMQRDGYFCVTRKDTDRGGQRRHPGLLLSTR